MRTHYAGEVYVARTVTTDVPTPLLSSLVCCSLEYIVQLCMHSVEVLLREYEKSDVYISKGLVCNMHACTPVQTHTHTHTHLRIHCIQFVIHILHTYDYTVVITSKMCFNGFSGVLWDGRFSGKLLY